MVLAGILLPILALRRVGGLGRIRARLSAEIRRFSAADSRAVSVDGRLHRVSDRRAVVHLRQPAIVQRVLSAKNEWHARMGVVSAGFLRILTPLFFVIPGIAAYKLFPELEATRRQDQAYLLLVKTLIPTGLKGLVLAGMARADVHGFDGSQFHVDVADNRFIQEAAPAAGERS